MAQVGKEENFAENLLAPYLEATLLSIVPWQSPKSETSALPDVVFKAFYTRKASPTSSTSTPDVPGSKIVICPPLASHIALSGDDAAAKAEIVFRTALKKFGVDENDTIPFWPPLEIDGDDDDD